jgi:hypothetical protein
MPLIPFKSSGIRLFHSIESIIYDDRSSWMHRVASLQAGYGTEVHPINKKWNKIEKRVGWGGGVNYPTVVGS